MLFCRKSSFGYVCCVYFGSRVYCCTWNVNGQPASVTLKQLFNATEESKPETHDCLPDIYAIGLVHSL